MPDMHDRWPPEVLGSDARSQMSRLSRLMYWTHRNAFYVISALYLASLFGQGAAWLSGKAQIPHLLTPIATATGLSVAALGLLHQQRMASARVYDELAARFDSAAVKRTRRLVAEGLLNKRLLDDDDWQDLLDFFEEIAHKARLGVVDVEILYQMFSDAILPYWFRLQDRLLKQRKNEYYKDVYTELQWLVESFCLRHPVGRKIFLCAWFPGPKKDSIEKVKQAVDKNASDLLRAEAKAY